MADTEIIKMNQVVNNQAVSNDGVEKDEDIALRKILAEEFSNLHDTISNAHKKCGETQYCVRTIQQITSAFYQKIVWHKELRNVRKQLVRKVTKSKKSYHYCLYDNSGFKVTFHAIPAHDSISKQSFPDSLNILIADYGSLHIERTTHGLTLNRKTIQRLSQGQSSVGIKSVQSLNELYAVTQVALFFCICYKC
jgi:hypothetical protein